MTDRTRQTVTLPDGRTLCFAEWGDPDGFPVVANHGHGRWLASHVPGATEEVEHERATWATPTRWAV